jgi:serine/threonine-protein kinase HipA
LAPVYDVVTTVAYNDFRNSPPGLSLAGRKTWQPGKSLERFAVTVCGLAPRTYRDIVDRTCQAAVEVASKVTDAMFRFADFRETGKRILSTWEEGIRDVSTAAKTSLNSVATMKSLVDAQQFSPASPKPKREANGRSELLGRRK